MAKYHIKKNGTPGVCHAQEGNCPLGGVKQHYNSLEEANNAPLLESVFHQKLLLDEGMDLFLFILLQFFSIFVII